MKKQYIVPAIHGHKLRIESHVLANSPIRIQNINWGNKQNPQYINNATTPTTEKFKFDEEQTTIDAWEGGISNI